MVRTLLHRIRWIKEHANGKLVVLLAKGDEVDLIEKALQSYHDFGDDIKVEIKEEIE